MRDHVTCEGCVWLVLRAFPWLSVLRREEALDHSWYDYRLTKGSIDEVGSGKRHTTVTVETQLICQIKTPLQPSLRAPNLFLWALSRKKEKHTQPREGWEDAAGARFSSI